MSAGKHKTARPSPQRPKRLLVEGPDDKWSIVALVQRHGLSFDSSMMPYVHDAEGAEQVLAAVSADAKIYRHLGVVLDADLDILKRWQALRGCLQGLGVQVPLVPSEGGLVCPGYFEDYRIGVWVMPNNRSTGMLEDFLRMLIAPDDPTWGHAEEATTRARELGAPISPLHQAKGAIHTWLAWREEPGKPFGTAITARYFRHDTPEALAFVAWFRELFEV